MVLISIILFLCPNWNCNGSEQKRIEILNLVDTINYWHVLIDGEVQLKANHHLEDSEKLELISKLKNELKELKNSELEVQKDGPYRSAMGTLSSRI